MLKIFSRLACISIAVCVVATYVVADDLDIKHIGKDGDAVVNNLTEFFQAKELSPFTSMRMKVMPDRGTRLIFPFILSDEDLLPKLNIFNANDSVFHITEDIDRVTGQPVLDIEYVEEPAEIRARLKQSGKFRPILGQVQISIGGYYIAIELESTLNIKEVVPNYVFQLSEEKRDHLINLAIERHKQSLELEYKERFNSIDEEAERLTINYIADLIGQDPKRKSLKVEAESSDKKMALYADRFEYFNDRYGVIHFEITNRTGRGLELSSVDFFGLSGDVQEKIDGYSNCNTWIEKRETRKCVFVTQNLDMHKFKQMETAVTGEEETWSIVW